MEADVFPSGDVLVALSTRLSTRLEGLAREPTLFLTYSNEGEPGDTVGWLPGSEDYYAPIGGSMAVIGRPYGLASQRALARGGMYFGSSVTYEIGWYNAAGGLERIIRRSVSNPRVTSEERAAYESERAEEYARSSPVFRGLLDIVELPETKPAYGRLLVDTDGNLWVAEYGRHPGELTRWNVFDPDGRWLGPVEAPLGLEILKIGSDYVLGVRNDEYDVEYVQLYEFSRGATE